MNARRLTVSSSHPESRARRSYLPIAPMPFLRLRGRWLDTPRMACIPDAELERLIRISSISTGRAVR